MRYITGKKIPETSDKHAPKFYYFCNSEQNKNENGKFCDTMFRSISHAIKSTGRHHI
ncbi:hypothetical protein GCM10022218_24710 [Sphingobacterium ginsenosidimutans]|uniref:Uncharacterized protein n=1 Tax=Sphingobacterium ginsenosidimutans TaxID=687845 RepID=A0ABP8A3L4_9SPHI